MVLDYTIFRQRAEALLGRLRASAQAAGREPAEVRLLPVTKNHPASAADFAVYHGFVSVGENRVQEAIEKQAKVAPKTAALKWELIGHLQSNKAKLAVANFYRVQTVDSERLLQKLDLAAIEQGRRLAILLQINAGHDLAKFGADPIDAPRLFEAALDKANLDVDGLMTIAPPGPTPFETAELARRTFSNLRSIRDQLQIRFGAPLTELSMGMSGDFEIAIAEGSTLVRIGTALFGER